MPTWHIALVPEVGTNLAELASVSAALQKQVTRDLAPLWKVSATVDAFPRLEQVPAGYWPVILTFRSLGIDEGVHIDQDGEPYALIEFSPSWSLTASHVCLEMLTDPTGSRTIQGPSPRRQQGTVDFLWGICDPCAHADYGYFVNDVLVSDFCTPAFWKRDVPPGSRRSFTGAIRASHDVLPGGHLAWYDPAGNCWWFRQNANDRIGDVRVANAGTAQGAVRDLVARQVPHLRSTRTARADLATRTQAQRERALRLAQSRAERLRSALTSAGKAGRPERIAAKPQVHARGRSGEWGALAALTNALDGAGAHDDEDATLRRATPVPPRPATLTLPPFPPPTRRSWLAGAPPAAGPLLAGSPSLTEASWVQSSPPSPSSPPPSSPHAPAHSLSSGRASLGLLVTALATFALLATCIVSRSHVARPELGAAASAVAVGAVAGEDLPAPRAGAPPAEASSEPCEPGLGAPLEDVGTAGLDGVAVPPASARAPSRAPLCLAAGGPAGRPVLPQAKLPAASEKEGRTERTADPMDNRIDDRR